MLPTVIRVAAEVGATFATLVLAYEAFKSLSASANRSSPSSRVYYRQMRRAVLGVALLMAVVLNAVWFL